MVNIEPYFSPQDLVNKMNAILFEWEYKDIIRASIDGEAKLAGFILGTCFIDTLAGFYCGVTKETATKGSGDRFKKFVRDYLPMYNDNKLYVDLRCGIVHAYATGSTYAFTDNEKAGKHLSTGRNGMIILNLEDFLDDLKTAYDKLIKNILSDDVIFQNAAKRFVSMGLMGLIEP